MARKRFTIRGQLAELRTQLTAMTEDARFFEGENRKLWTRNNDLVQRNKLLQEQVALQRLIIEEQKAKLARAVRVDNLTPSDLKLVS